MPYDHTLEDRIDLLSVNWPGFSKKKMFGGLGYLLRGNMAFGILKAQLVVRCGPERHVVCLARPGVCEFDVTGRPMRGWIMVSDDGLDNDNNLLDWLEAGRDFAAGLPSRDDH